VLELGKDTEGETQKEAPASDHSVAGILRLIGAGAGTQILMALGRGALRTGQLTDRIQDFSARSVYRHAGEMEDFGLIVRDQEPGVPSKVVLRLSEPTGRELYRLLRAFAVRSAPGLSGRGRPAPEPPLDLLGELWDLGFLEELSYEPRSLAQFARGEHELTFHQVNRRIGLFISSGLLAPSPPAGNGKRYELTRYGRRCMALIAGIGRWRRRVLPDRIPGLTLAETATVLRAAMPLTALPDHAGKRIGLVVTGPMGDGGHRNVETLQGTVDDDGTLRCTQGGGELPEGSAGATINIWFAALLDGNRGRLRVRGNLEFVDSFLTQLYDKLWETSIRSRPPGTGAGDD
jgi:DNA-binding HxlR family transcriptional regulator